MACQNMDLHLYFQKVIWPGGETVFEPQKILKKPNLLECAPVLVVTWVNSIPSMLFYPPIN